MSSIHEIQGTHGDIRLNVVFVHGLNGHHVDTWTCPGENGEFWPRWLIDDAPGVRISSIEYAAPATRWASRGMTLADRAANIAALLAADEKYLNSPLALVGHSLGGNVIKAVVRHLHDYQETDPRFKKLFSILKLVIFIGTPHSGSGLRKKVPYLLRKIFRPSDVAHELEAESPILRDLNLWYRSNAPSGSKHIVLVETQPMANSVVVVSPSSSDPGIANVNPIPIDADHTSICKPNDRENQVYKIILDAIKDALLSEYPLLLQDPTSIVAGPADQTQRRRKGIKARVDSHRASLIDAGEKRPFTVFLCGPTPTEGAPSPAAILCSNIATLLQNDHFDVVFGQAQGLEDDRLGSNENSLGRELSFIGSKCNAVVLIASGATGWSELGLFGWYMATDKTIRSKGIDIVVIADEAEVDNRAFLASGPISYGEAVGRADITSLASFDAAAVLQRMRARRSMFVMSRKGRPKRTAA